MGFKRDEVSRLFADVKRRCCICYRFCGSKIETDHIIPEADGGTDDIDNAIPVCFECHAEIHSYNDRHPRGRKFLPDELRAHRENWLKVCREHPEVLVASSHAVDVGPLQALIDELDFNVIVCSYTGSRGALFVDEQFRRAIAHGAISTLESGLKRTILEAYAAMSRANQLILVEINLDPRGLSSGHLGFDTVVRAAINAITEATPKVSTARDQLLTFLSSEEASTTGVFNR